MQTTQELQSSEKLADQLPLVEKCFWWNLIVRCVGDDHQLQRENFGLGKATSLELCAEVDSRFHQSETKMKFDGRCFLPLQTPTSLGKQIGAGKSRVQS